MFVPLVTAHASEQRTEAEYMSIRTSRKEKKRKVVKERQRR
jgi:hypothetical protein